MEQVSQLILRNAELLRTGHVLLVNPPRDSCFTSLSQHNRQISVFSQDFGDYSYLSSSGAEAEFGLIPSADSTTRDIVLILPRERKRLEMLVHALASSMPPQSVLWLAGENRSGIKSSAQRLRPFFQSVTKIDSARHCTLLRACDPTPPSPFDLKDYKTTWPLTFSDAQIDIVSLPGTFAHGKLDRGTELLLDSLEELKPTGQVLDFACGSGVIGLSLLHLQTPPRLSLLDVSALALESVHMSLRANGKEATVLASDGLSHLQGSFDWIISNPPFHRGVRNDLDIARKFFSQAGKFLTKTGKILLVYNHHLPYVVWLKEHFTRLEVVRTNGRFKIVMAAGIRR